MCKIKLMFSIIYFGRPSSPTTWSTTYYDACSGIRSSNLRNYPQLSNLNQRYNERTYWRPDYHWEHRFEPRCCWDSASITYHNHAAYHVEPNGRKEYCALSNRLYIIHHQFFSSFTSHLTSHPSYCIFQI